MYFRESHVVSSSSFSQVSVVVVSYYVVLVVDTSAIYQSYRDRSGPETRQVVSRNAILHQVGSLQL